MRLMFAVLIILGVLSGCSDNGTGNQRGARPSLAATATITALPSPMESTSLPTPAPDPTHSPIAAPSPTEYPDPSIAPPVATTPTLPPTPTTEATGTLRPVEDTNPTWTPQALPGTWRGLTLAPEVRCSPYDSGDYPYSQSVEKRDSRGDEWPNLRPLHRNPFRRYTSDRHRAHCRTVRGPR